MRIEKDKKGKCWIVSHKRAGYHEQISGGMVSSVKIVHIGEQGEPFPSSEDEVDIDK